ncbi:MAG: 2-hydroxyacid dehydrogenase [Qingshengfaniella sp.]
MSINILYAGAATEWPVYRQELGAALEAAGLIAELHDDPARAAEVDYIVYAPDGPVSDFRPFTRARAVLSLWAGVEAIAPNPTLTQPLARMVDPSLTEGMVEWVTGHVLRHHLGIDASLTCQDGVWAPAIPPLARERTVGILGLGVLGAACASALAGLNFDVAGWSRRPRQLPGVRGLSGSKGLTEILERSEILVLLLPLTSETDGLICSETLAHLPRGAVLLNPGRGPLIDDDALLAALASGRLAHATLDVFRVEPLPPAHPFWSDPRITVTPHIASATRPPSAARAIAENIRRGEAGLPFLNLVDRAAGY